MLNACSNNKAQSKKFYRLNTSAVASSDVSKPMTLVVKRPSALSILGGRPIVATQEDGSLIQLSNNFWLESPKVLLQDSIKQWAAQHWQDVTYRQPTDNTYQILETRILAFEKQHNQAKVSLEFSLIDDDDRIILNQQFDATTDISGTGYKAFTTAIGSAVDSVLNELSQQLSYVE
ncbi:MAG: ABC-type transport auxiliary lipoprotein family protein [Marinicella sp.]